MQVICEMKVRKAASLLFVVIGLLFAVLGIIRYVVVLAEKEDCIYATAYIVRIDERETGDEEFPIDYTTYVELDVLGEKRTVQLNTYRTDFSVGKPIDVYYFEDDLQMVYEEKADVFLILFAFGGIVFFGVGVAMLLNRKMNSAFFEKH